MAENEDPVVETATTETPVVETPTPETPVVEGPKSAAEALDAGLEQVPQRTKQEADKVAGKVEGKEGADAGKDEKKDGGKDDPKAGEKKPDEKDPKKDADHVNDPIPKEFGERAQERIRSLVGYVKERDEALTVQGNLIKAIQDTGATPEGFADMIGYLRAANSQKPEDLQQALKMVQAQARDLSFRLGIEAPGVDLLEGHPELQEAVKYGQITRAHALKIAQFETQQKQSTAAATAKAEQEQTTAQLEAAKTSAIKDLDALGEHLHKTDPDYQRKFDLLALPLREVFGHLHPSLWKGAFEKAYAKMSLPAAPAADAPPPPGMVRDATTGQFVKKNTPIRPVQPAGQGSKAPGSAREAMDAAIDSLR